MIWYHVYFWSPNIQQNYNAYSYSQQVMALERQQRIEYERGLPAFLTTERPTSNAEKTS